MTSVAKAAPECIWPLEATLGEGPIWHPVEQMLYFVDIKQHKLHRCDAHGENRQTWDMPGETGFALPAERGGFICGLAGKLVHFDPATGEFTPVTEFEADRPGNRLNDGHVAHDGAVWFGSMDNAEASASGALYRYDGELRSGLTRHDDGIIITNGPAFSPDRKTFYHTDTFGKTVYAFDVTAEGTLANKRVFATIDEPGWPDGSAVDAAGNVWVAVFRGARVLCYSPAGELLDTIAFPVPNITKIAFGGPDLKTAFATTATKGLTPDERAAAPLAGGVFAFPVDVPGLPQHMIGFDK
ncbi:SMP-30/gluconolactonase/LRE family protein [Pseudoduganella umbonata]|uniref:SMP-30/gluconolactonase/LRE family protein n=1 Tax=Pseudoduganella umbonata TaxID=864828 RepID=A0A4P8HWQ1_9BURK|nr:SMP-30/gluconolactonase/LRE family protein [Pseudoduganella umbonata]MBB3223258.1 sugar lactone lactonase YvrE [Pseudoduganella umbonata]QCP13826.1 SMP-30/gluconolactonase/LRE family protein [Pseudoduganella umbonata]